MSPVKTAAPVTTVGNEGDTIQRAADTTMIPPMPRTPLWRVPGYRLARPGPTTPQERQAAAEAARARLRAADDHRHAVKAFDAEICGEYGVDRGPSTYGMTSAQRRAYGAHLLEHGWSSWEVRTRIAAPEAVSV